jgi:hypothetical protein
MAPSGNSRMIFVEINMPSDLVELGGLEPPAPCLQRAGSLRHTVADLGLVDLHCRPNRQVVRGCCGQDCGQRPREAHRRLPQPLLSRRQQDRQAVSRQVAVQRAGSGQWSSTTSEQAFLQTSGESAFDLRERQGQQPFRHVLDMIMPTQCSSRSERQHLDN